MEAHEKGYFTEENSVEVVTGRNVSAKDARLKQIMEVVTRKLHEAVKELEPTQEEWMQAILFLTRTGQMCNEWRQEFILLSDVLGVSMLVETINHEFRTPLAALIGHVELIHNHRDDTADLDPELSGWLAAIERSGWRLRDLIEKVADMVNREDAGGTVEPPSRSSRAS
jgi:signal transduction histidine kinase